MPKDIQIDLKDYSYNLPEEKIAFEGTRKRAQSRMLYYEKGKIHDRTFFEIVDLIPQNASLFFNNTKVIPARLLLTRDTGAKIEIFLLKPAFKKDIAQSLESTCETTWECMIGNLKKWNLNEALHYSFGEKSNPIHLKAKLVEKEQKLVEFSWDGNISFAQVLDILGKTPLPPYIKRSEISGDKKRYQTVYSKVEGAVAAPTAGLHFTDSILQKLKHKGVKEEFFTLHVGAGTFMPIKAEKVEEHPMHNETMSIPVETIEAILKAEFRIAVGTTSMRTMESLYWYGVMLLKDPGATFSIKKLYPYSHSNQLPTVSEAFEAIVAKMKRDNLKEIHGETEIFIFPGYSFKVCNALITNFHQPGSTLILLVAAFVGSNWRKIYKHALDSNYRFLSFGDSSLLIP
ncbi:MAG: S-adenosylmethionine:tRNA ribosyltransferase-isomerase [Cyclobacteriaceae bacterium]|nr:S-adenosylmethionine:tRNA ribosyltransferase-isomerase [Cyclobacteriaceae bacterium]